MLPRKKRLTTKLFPAVVMKGRTIQGNFFSLKVVSAKEQSRFSVIVSKKIDSRAVVRNKIKRQALSIVQKLIKKVEKSEKFAHGGFFAKKGVEKASFTEIGSDIQGLFQKAGIL